MFLLLQNTMAAVILTDVSYHKWFFKWTNLSLETATFQLGHVCLPAQQILSWCLKQARKHQKREWAFLYDCHRKTKSASTHSMQNNSTVLQRSKSAVTMQGPIPLTGLLRSGQMRKEKHHPVELSYTKGNSWNNHTIKQNTHRKGQTEAWEMRQKKAAKQTHPAVLSFLFFRSSALPRSRPRTALCPWAHYAQAHPCTTNNSGALTAPHHLLLDSRLAPSETSLKSFFMLQ